MKRVGSLLFKDLAFALTFRWPSIEGSHEKAGMWGPTWGGVQGSIDDPLSGWLGAEYPRPQSIEVGGVQVSLSVVAQLFRGREVVQGRAEEPPEVHFIASHQEAERDMAQTRDLNKELKGTNDDRF